MNDINNTLVAVVGAVTAVRVLVVMLQKLALGTVTEEDDKLLGRIASLLDRVERALDWVSVGPTSRKR